MCLASFWAAYAQACREGGIAYEEALAVTDQRGSPNSVGRCRLQGMDQKTY